jgi:hypothetical protein
MIQTTVMACQSWLLLLRMAAMMVSGWVLLAVAAVVL